MFNFFRKKKECLISEETRIWMEDAFLWLMKEFGESSILERRVILPTKEYFDFSFDFSESMAQKILKIVAENMDVDSTKINLSIYDDPLIEIDGDMGYTLQTQRVEGYYPTGLYSGKNKDGIFSISVERKQLEDPGKLISTLSHEISHIKILGEGRLDINDEYLTDLVTVFFGLGIFSANSSFIFYKDSSKWGYTQMGYLIQQEWAYALALFAYIRFEKNPSWVQFLSQNIKSDYKKCEDFIYENTDKVLV